MQARCRHQLGFIVFGALSYAMVAAHAQAPSELISTVSHQSMLINKLALFDSLLNTSPTVNLIIAGDPTDEPHILLNFARRERAHAENLFNGGEITAAESAIDAALQALSKASRRTAARESQPRMQQQTYNSLVQRSRSYIAAFRRAREDHDSVEVDFDETYFHETLTKAERLAAEHRFSEANTEIALMLELLERALTHLRHRETLVHSLEFDSPTEAFDYERQRNDSHQLLIDLLQREKNLPIASLSMIEALTESNRSQRERAEHFYETGDMAAALTALEAGTAELVRVLRLMGVSF